MIRAIIFDLDGTLVDTELLWVAALERYLEETGRPLSHEDAMSVVLGRSWHDIYAEICRLHPNMNISIDEMSHELLWRFNEQKEGTDIRIHESVDFLCAVAESYPVSIVSGSTRREIQSAVELMGISDHVRFFLGAEDYSPGKPDPTCFLKAAKRFGVQPPECLVLEDSSAGVAAAKSAGMKCVALRRPGTPFQDLSAADQVVDSLAQLAVAELG